MAADELNVPLGKTQKTGRFARLQQLRLPLSFGQLLALVCGLFLIVFLSFALFGNNPLGGEPGVRITIDPALLAKPRNAPAAAQSTAASATPSASAPVVRGEQAAQGASAVTTPAPGQKTITIIDGSSGERRDVVVPASNEPGKPSSSAPQTMNEGGLFETSRYGEIPIISPAGIKPMQAYAQTVDVPAAAIATTPSITLVVTGLGIGAARTEQALQKLPRTVTLAFVPYGGELPALVAKARQRGHEIVLQIPMEPFDYPDNDPGPQTLLTTTSAEQNLDRLAWHLSRMKGYVGVANFMGGRFMATEAAIRTVTGDLKKRGLIFLDDGSTLRSAAGAAAKDDKVPFLRADVAIDSTNGPAEIDKILARLEGLARQRGTAVGVVAATPVVVERIDAWSRSLDSKGVIMLPLTAAMRKLSPS